MEPSHLDKNLEEENQNERVAYISSSMECVRELKLGMKVYSKDEAYNMYNQYALSKGFSIRKGNKRRTLNEPIRQREYVCSKAGFREFEDASEVKKFSHLETRTGCKARIRFIVENGVWMIHNFNDVHNHELAIPEEKSNLRSGRKVPKAHGNVISSMVAVGIKPVKSYSYLAKEIGAENNIGFKKRDCHNFLSTLRKTMIEAGDGQSVMNYFKHKQAEDPMFFYSIQVDQDNRMANFFWRDGRSKLDYDCFGDVVVFDTTYRTNKYNLVCAPFVGINHHWKNVLFGCAFLVDETTESFIWLFETFLESVGQRQPKCIFTDQDQAMTNAIESVLPQARHRLCLWHIANNARKHLAGLYANHEFKVQFNKCVHKCETVAEFESTWSDMIKRFELDNHSWLCRLYDLRQKWCPAFSMDIFSARMRSTQRSESINSVFHQIMLKPMSLVQVLHYYEGKTDEMRREELDDDFRCKNGAPANVKNRGILKHASEVYTLVIFKIFEEELLDSMGLNCIQVSIDKYDFVYEVMENNCDRVYVVHFDLSKRNISCSCNLFKTLGLLCSHSLRVLVMNNINEIPSQYILRRWTKCVREGMISNLVGTLQKDEKSAQVLRLSELNHIGHHLFDKGSMSEKCTQIVKEKLFEALELVEREMTKSNSMTNASNFDKESFQLDANKDVCEPLLDPPCIRMKGLTNARIKSKLEKHTKKKLKCGSSKQIPQRSRSMPGRKKQRVIEPSQSSLQPPNDSTCVHMFQPLGMPINTGYENQVNSFGSSNQFVPPQQISSSNWANGLSNLNFTRMLQENLPISYLNEEFTSCDSQMME